MVVAARALEVEAGLAEAPLLEGAAAGVGSGEEDIMDDLSTSAVMVVGKSGRFRDVEIDEPLPLIGAARCPCLFRTRRT